MQRSKKVLTGALIAGLVSGSLALAEQSQATGANGTAATPAPKATKRKPHDHILNKNKCCKDGCGCKEMEEPGKSDAPKDDSKKSDSKD